MNEFRQWDIERLCDAQEGKHSEVSASCFYVRDVCSVKVRTVSQRLLRHEQDYPAISHSIAQGDKEDMVSTFSRDGH
jgi:hypothetical protein